MRRLVSGLVLLLLPVAQLNAAPGDLDPGFGIDGMVRTAIGSDAVAGGVAIDANGRIVVAGGADYEIAVLRYEPDGTLDGTFGTAGVVRIPESPPEGGAEVIVIQPDGRLLLNGGGKVRRLLADGSIDTGFGVGGAVAFSDSDGTYLVEIELLPDGRILTGFVKLGLFESGTRWLRRLLPDGTLDSTFTTVVQANGDFTGTGRLGLAVMPDGRLVLAGGFDLGPFPSSNRHWVLQRFLPDGAVDETFGPGGLAVGTPSGSNCCTGAISVVRSAAGDLVAAGNDAQGGLYGPAAARFRDDGTTDTSFGSGGVARSIGDDAGSPDVTIQDDGRIVVSGGAFRLIRYLPNGMLDPAFGSGGIATAPFAPYSNVFRMARQPDGKFVLVGRENHVIALARFLDDEPCGNGQVDAGEACDGTPCCTSLCTLAPAGTVCRAGAGGCDPVGACDGSSDACPVGSGDDDGDGICDDVDPCVQSPSGGFSAPPTAKLVLERVGADMAAGNDKLSLSGELSLPAAVRFADLDLLSSGARIVLTTGTDATSFDPTVASGAFTGVRGWRRNSDGTMWLYRDRSTAPVNGIVVFRARARDALPGGKVAMRVRARNGTYAGVVPGAEPVRGTVVLGDATASASGICGGTSFVAAECTWRRATKLICKR